MTCAGVRVVDLGAGARVSGIVSKYMGEDRKVERLCMCGETNVICAVVRMID